MQPRQTRIEVSAKGYGTIDEQLEVIDRPVRHDFLLTPEATIVGRVVRADDGRPVANASARSVGSDLGARVSAPAAAISGADGRFALGGVAPGGSDLSPSRPGWR